MRSISRTEIHPMKMTNNPPSEVVNAGYKVINNEDGHVYDYVGIGWVKSKEKATKEDYKNIPELIS